MKRLSAISLGLFPAAFATICAGVFMDNRAVIGTGFCSGVFLALAFFCFGMIKQMDDL